MDPEEMNDLIAKHGDSFRAYLEDADEGYASEDDFEDRYEGEHDNAKAFADQLIEDQLDTLKGMIEGAVYDTRTRKHIIDMLESLASHIDAESLEVDLKAEGYNFVQLDPGGNVFVFRP